MNEKHIESIAGKIEEMRTEITVEDFIAQFDTLEAGRLYKLPEWPTDEDAQLLSRLKIEVSVMQLPNDDVVISKGNSKRETAMTRGELLAFKPVKKAHTHPVQPISQNALKRFADRAGIRFEDIDQEIVAKMGIILPSPDDLTLGSVGAEVYEIWSEYGKTVYQPYANGDQDIPGFSFQITSNLYSGSSFTRILLNSELGVEEKIDEMNALLGALGLAFTFEAWE